MTKGRKQKAKGDLLESALCKTIRELGFIFFKTEFITEQHLAKVKVDLVVNEFSFCTKPDIFYL